MKYIALFAILVSLNANALESFEFTLTGKTASGPNANEDAYVRKLIAGFVEKLWVKRYFLRTTPANGGFRVCVQTTDDTAYGHILGELNGFAIRESIWDIKEIHGPCRP